MKFEPYDGDTPRLDIWLQNGTESKVLFIVY